MAHKNELFFLYKLKRFFLIFSILVFTHTSTITTEQSYFNWLPATLKNNRRFTTILGCSGFLLMLHFHRLYSKENKPQLVANKGNHTSGLIFWINWYDDVIIGQLGQNDAIVANTETGFLEIPEQACSPVGLFGNLEYHLQIMENTLSTVAYLLGVPMLFYKVYNEWDPPITH